MCGRRIEPVICVVPREYLYYKYSFVIGGGELWINDYVHNYYPEGVN